MHPNHFVLRLGFPVLLVLATARLVQAGALEDWTQKMRPIVPQGYVCARADQPVQIDGRLDEAAWQAAPWTRDFTDIEGDAKPKPRFRTRAKMLWDENYFYVAAEMEEPHVWAVLTNHDAVIFHDPDFEVFIDPDGDGHDYYEFELNALNTGWDLILKKPYKDGGPALNSWEIPGLKTAVHVRGTLNHAADRDEGWSVELAFPWKALGEFHRGRTPPGEGDHWRAGFSRVEWDIDIVDGRYQKVKGRPEHNWIWSAQGVIDMHRPEKWGYVQFTRQPPGTVAFQPDPAAPAREVLQTIYYAQKDFRAQHRRWAASLDELNPGPALGAAPALAPALKPTPDGYEATVTFPPAQGARQVWRIRQDARVWREQ